MHDEKGKLSNPRPQLTSPLLLKEWNEISGESTGTRTYITFHKELQYIRLVHNAVAILFRLLIPVAIGLFIVCHFLFELQLLYLNLHQGSSTF